MGISTVKRRRILLSPPEGRPQAVHDLPYSIIDLEAASSLLVHNIEGFQQALQLLQGQGQIQHDWQDLTSHEKLSLFNENAELQDNAKDLAQSFEDWFKCRAKALRLIGLATPWTDSPAAPTVEKWSTRLRRHIKGLGATLATSSSNDLVGLTNRLLIHATTPGALIGFSRKIDSITDMRTHLTGIDVPESAPAEVSVEPAKKQRQQGPRRKRPTRQFQINKRRNTVSLDGETHSLTPDQILILAKLRDAKGGWLTLNELRILPDTKTRIDLMIKRLPEPIQKLIQPKTKGIGYRLKLRN